jgi:hypothetical protein
MPMGTLDVLMEQSLCTVASGRSGKPRFHADRGIRDKLANAFLVDDPEGGVKVRQDWVLGRDGHPSRLLFLGYLVGEPDGGTLPSQAYEARKSSLVRD